MKLHISGGTHFFTSVDERLTEIENNSHSIDAVFVEARDPSNSGREKILNWLSSPFLLGGISLWLIFLEIVTKVVSGDQEIVEELAATEGVETYHVDKPVHDIISSQRKMWGLSNWTIVLLPAALFLLVPNLTMLTISLSLIVAGSASLMIAYLAGINTERNLHMIETIDDIVSEEEFSESVLIIGGHHEEGIRDLAGRFENIQVVDSQFEKEIRLQS